MTLTGIGGDGTIDTSGGNVTLFGVLSGGGGLVKAGSGLSRCWASNSYSGNTTINTGTLLIATPALLGSGGVYNGNISIAAGAILNYNSTASQILVGTIGGSGSITQTANSLLTLAASSIYSAAFSQTAGTLQLAPGGQFLAGSDYFGGTFMQTGGTVAAGTYAVTGTFSYTGGAFNGRLVNGGTALFISSFFAGQGVENDTSLAVPVGIAVGATSGGTANNIDNEGTITLAGGTLAGGRRRAVADRSSITG